MKDGMLLFHGSYCPVKTINLNKCMSGKDFGKGFYLTSDERQARNFIEASLSKAHDRGDAPLGQNFGYVSSFIFNDSGLATYHFETTDREWLWFVSLNRNHGLARKLRPLINPAIFDAEIISGKIANDRTNPTILAYLSGLFGDIMTDEVIDFAIKRLMANRLKDQFCFLTERAVKCLKFQEARKYVIG